MLRWTSHLNGGRHRDFHAGVAVGHKVYYFKAHGNMYDREHMNVHIFNTVSLRWTKLPRLITDLERPFEVPSKLPAMLDCYTPVLIQDTIYLWGWKGTYSKKSYNVLFGFDVGTHRWFKPKVSGTLPEETPNYAASVLGKVIYICGGCTRLTGLTNVIYKLDTTTMGWSLVDTRGSLPPALEPQFATIVGTKMFVFGDNPTISVFDTETNCWLSTPSAELPGERWDHAAFAYNGELYIFRSCSGKQTFNDLWKLNTETFSWKKTEPKGNGPNQTSGMCCCTAGDLVTFFGGKDTPDVMYILDLSPCLKTLCKLAVTLHSLEQSELPPSIKWEMAAMTANSK